MKEVIWKVAPHPPHFIPKLLQSPRWALLEQLLEVAEDVFNGVQVGAAGREEDGLDAPLLQEPLGQLAGVDP